MLTVVFPHHAPCVCTLCSGLSIDLLAISAFPLKLLTFTSDVCIFPVVERLSSPSVPCYSSYAVFLPAEWSEYKRDKVNMLLYVSRSTLVVALVGHLLDLNNPVPLRIPPTVIVMDCPTNRHLHPPRSLYISHADTVAVTSFISQFPTVYPLLFLLALQLTTFQCSNSSFHPAVAASRYHCGLLFLFI